MRPRTLCELETPGRSVSSDLTRYSIIAFSALLNVDVSRETREVNDEDMSM